MPFLQISGLFPIPVFQVFLPFYVLTIKMMAVKFNNYSISGECSRYQDTGATDPSLVDDKTSGLLFFLAYPFLFIIFQSCLKEIYQ